MNLPDLKLLHKILNWHATQNEHAGEVGIFIPLPSEIAKQFPDDGRALHDKSPSHITLIYIGAVPEVFENRIRDVVHAVCSRIKPFKVRLGRPGKFMNEEKQEIVLHSTVKSKRLEMLHHVLKNQLLKCTIPVDNKHPEFKPHVTIEYVKVGEKPKYKQLRPEGEWIVDCVWVWGTKEPILIPLGK